jgi:ABC-2 type transport system permease protein
MEQVSAEMFAGEQGQRQMDAFLGQVAATKPAPGSEDADLQGLLIQTKKWNARQSAKPAAERKGAGGMSVPYELKEEAIQSGKLAYNSFGHSFAGMGVQFILFMGIEAGVGILLARRSGLWKRLRAAPVSRGLLLGARTTSTAILATGLLGAIFLIARLLFGVRIEGSLLGFGVLALAFGALVGTFGLLIAALGRTPEATRGLAIFVTLVLVMLGGAWIPAFLFPAWVQKLTLLAPTRWAIDGLDGVIWRGYTFAETLPAIGAVAAFALLFGVLAVWRFRWEEG